MPASPVKVFFSAIFYIPLLPFSLPDHDSLFHIPQAAFYFLITK